MVSAVICLCEVSETNVMLSIDLLAIFTVKTSVMNLLLFLFVLLFSFFSVKDQIASFQLEEIVGQFHVRQ